MNDNEEYGGGPKVIVVNDEEFEHFLYHMQNPKGPTDAILAGAKLLKELHKAKLAHPLPGSLP